MSTAEIAAATAALLALYRSEGRALLAAKEAAAPAFARHPGMSCSAQGVRYQTATAFEQVSIDAMGKHRRDRRDIRDALDEVRSGVMPRWSIGARLPAVAAILAGLVSR